MSGISLGAYGFRFVGLDELDPWLVEAPEHWPIVRLSQTITDEIPERRMDAGRAVIPLLGGGSVEVTRHPMEVTFISTESVLSGAAIAHPYLAPAASVLASWSGLAPIHGGAILVDGLAWLLIGDRESGKSSTLAELAGRGVPVVADDLVVVGDDRARAGPRSLDLRDGRFGEGLEELGVVGRRPRWRLRLPPVPAESPVGGVIHLGWAETVSERRLGPDDIGGVLESSTAMPLQPMQVLTMLALPTYELIRPPDGVVRTADLVLDLIGGA